MSKLTDKRHTKNLIKFYEVQKQKIFAAIFQIYNKNKNMSLIPDFSIGKDDIFLFHYSCNHKAISFKIPKDECMLPENMLLYNKFITPNYYSVIYKDTLVLKPEQFFEILTGFYKFYCERIDELKFFAGDINA